MTAFEATVEIVKVALEEQKGSNIHHITNDHVRKELLKGIEEVFNKFLELEEKDKESRKPVGHQF